MDAQRSSGAIVGCSKSSACSTTVRSSIRAVITATGDASPGSVDMDPRRDMMMDDAGLLSSSIDVLMAGQNGGDAAHGLRALLA